ncbi:MAG: DNA mismatch repair endonuclease MutL [Acetobacteraceae bacterium]|nr:DNA mismatch repair endonuclease MutL [Acetobacteraceae bacterium]
MHHPGRIRLLPEVTINRIAAGEVIERPAAAARELVENATDAGATRIAVAIAAGGMDRIEVSDNGAGMTGEDLALAVQRHATSKLIDDNDLLRIETLGFRGEALPSIGAAARLEITSRPDAVDHATMIRVEGGTVQPPEPSAGARGTRVVVRDLFFATPARRKFLKSPRAEADATETAINRLALAAPGIAFRLESDGRVLFDLPAQDRRARIAALLGAEAAAALLEIGGERDGLILSGFICPPTITRATAAAQTLVVNGRPVADPTLRTAVRVAFRDVIAHGRHPVVALFLDLPSDQVDVNVHPGKAEVRFRSPDAVRGLIISTLTRALGVGINAPAPGPSLTLRQSWYATTPGAQHRGFADMQLGLAAPPLAKPTAPLPDLAEFPLGAPVAQVLDTYIIAVTGDGTLVLVDQHAAHERLTHEAIRDQMLAGGVRAQPMLLPAVVNLPPGDAARLLARAADLALLGLELEEFGVGAILVRAMPAALGAPDPAPLLRDLADELAEMDETTALPDRLDAVIARMACHGSIRAGRRLGPEEMSALLRQMEATPRAATCSHGRPTFLKLSKPEIERMFGRR